MGVGGQRHAPAVLLAGKRPGTHFITGWVGPRVVLTVAENIAPTGIFFFVRAIFLSFILSVVFSVYLYIDPRTVQPVASRHTDWAVLAHILYSSGETELCAP
jgi:hypothetical protein